MCLHVCSTHSVLLKVAHHIALTPHHAETYTYCSQTLVAIHIQSRERGWGKQQHFNAPAVTLSPSAMTTLISCGRRLYTSLAGSVRGGKGGQLKVTAGQLSAGRHEAVDSDCSSIATNTTHTARPIFDFNYRYYIELRSYDIAFRSSVYVVENSLYLRVLFFLNLRRTEDVIRLLLNAANGVCC